jgi:mannose-6-phosphate isomerase-like protein (cupin superfamily)
MAEPEVLRHPLLGATIGTRTSDFVIHENRDDGGQPPRRGIPLHRHHSEDEAWYVLEGTLRFQYGSEEFDAHPGAGVLLPRGTAHTFWNAGPGSVRYLMIVGPKTEGLLEALHRPGQLSPDQMKEIYNSFDVELLE